MSLEKIDGFERASRALEANLSTRASEMRKLERFVEGTQYQGLPDWFSDEKPLWERAPCVVYPIAQGAIGSNADLLFGEGRFPQPRAVGLEGEALESAESALAEVCRRARFARACREVFEAAQGSRSAAAIFGVRKGRLVIDTVRGRWCEPELDDDGECLSLTIQYPYLTVEKQADGRPIVKAKLYRRVIDAESDTTFAPADARDDGLPPKWTAGKVIKHGLGRCPVIWYPHMRGCAIVDTFDGKALHENVLDEIRAHDFALSQRHRAALWCGDPQWTEAGVEPGSSPAPKGRRGIPGSLTGADGAPTTSQYIDRPRGGGKGRKKGPGVVWQYGDPNVKVTLHTLPGDALDAIDKHARDLKIKIAESLGVVFLDPESLPTLGALSGKALAALKARQLDRCDGYREDFGDRFMIPALGMLLHIARAVGLDIEGLDATDDELEIDLAWGRYFRADADEEAKAVELSVKALDGGVATKRMALEKLRAVFDIKDVDAVLEELEEEADEAFARQQEAAAALMRDPGESDNAGKQDGGAAPGGKGSEGPGKARAGQRESADED